LAIQSVSSTPTQAAAGQPISKQIITQDSFLKLLIAQLKNQDPLQPMDNQQFAVQLATFNSLEQLIGINDKLGNLRTAQGAANQFNAASLIGKTIASSGNTVNVQAGNPSAINYRLGANASRVVINVEDSSGALVRQMVAGAQNAGDQSLVWDGKDTSGKAVPSGLYNFEINAFDLNGKQVQALGRIKGIVTGVRLDGAEPLLELGALQVPLSAVTSVSAPN
jgi:flagellar basal-body rod modification protein FlgD